MAPRRRRISAWLVKIKSRVETPPPCINPKHTTVYVCMHIHRQTWSLLDFGRLCVCVHMCGVWGWICIIILWRSGFRAQLDPHDMCFPVSVQLQEGCTKADEVHTRVFLVVRVPSGHRLCNMRSVGEICIFNRVSKREKGFCQSFFAPKLLNPSWILKLDYQAHQKEEKGFRGFRPYFRCP